MSPDSYCYSRWADTLISDNFNMANYQKNMEALRTPYLYLGFISFVALTKIIAGAYWQQLIVIINVISGALLAVMLADLVYIFTSSKVSTWLTFIIYAFNPEIISWSRYILSDVSYMFLNFAISYSITKAFSTKDRVRVRYWAITIFVLLVSIFYRPPGTIMIPIVLFAFYINQRKKEMRWKPFFTFFALFILAFIFIHAAVIKNIWSMQSYTGNGGVKGFIVFLYKNGIIIHDRPHTYHNAPSALLDYVFITIDKFIHYFYFSDRLFSSTHNVVNYLYFVPLYVLSILGVLIVKRESSSIKRSLIALSAIVIVAYSLSHSVTIIDFDWRYRLPILPYLIFVAGLGINFLIEQNQRG